MRGAQLNMRRRTHGEGEEVSVNMRRLLLAMRVGRTAAMTLLIVTGVSASEAAQQNRASEVTQASGPLPRMSDGKPDLTGVWGEGRSQGEREALAVLESLYTSAARAKMQEFSEVDDPLFRCLPYGVPRSILSSPWPYEIVQRPAMMVVLTEYYHAFRLVTTDGSPHPQDALPSYFGDSAGRWEGDTLVVDIVAFNDKTWLADARDKPTPTSRGTWLHSDALHVVERWRLVGADALEYQAIVEDPQMLTRPWTSPVVTFKRQPFAKIGEGMCFDTTTYDLIRKR